MRRKKNVITVIIVVAMIAAFSITSFASSYSRYWRSEADGSWKYYVNGLALATNAWIHDHDEWYLVDSEGNMRTGVFQSNDGKYYLLDTVQGTGTYGKLLKDGMVYQGITLSCDTSDTYEGALSEESIEALSSLFDFSNAPYVANTRHIEDKTNYAIPNMVKSTDTKSAENVVESRSGDDHQSTIGGIMGAASIGDREGIVVYGPQGIFTMEEYKEYMKEMYGVDISENGNNGNTENGQDSGERPLYGPAVQK